MPPTLLPSHCEADLIRYNERFVKLLTARDSGVSSPNKDEIENLLSKNEYSKSKLTSILLDDLQSKGP